MSINFVLMGFLGEILFNLLGLRQSFNIASIVGSVVECSPATRAARVRFPDDANIFSSLHYPSVCFITLIIMLVGINCRIVHL